LSKTKIALRLSGALSVELTNFHLIETGVSSKPFKHTANAFRLSTPQKTHLPVTLWMPSFPGTFFRANAVFFPRSQFCPLDGPPNGGSRRQNAGENH
jgi:hypothetical protein